MTPWQLGQVVDGHNERMRDDHQARAWLAWHTAALGRAKKLPKLSELTRPAGPRRLSEDEFSAHLKALSQRNS